MQQVITTDQYDSWTIDAIEDYAVKHRDDAFSNYRNLMEILFYLRRTGRYRENRLFASSSFDQYLRGRYMLTEYQFERARRVYITHAKHAEQYGPGIVQKILMRVPVEAQDQAFAEMAAKASVPGKDITAIVDKVIHKYTYGLPEKAVIESTTRTVDRSNEVITKLRRENAEKSKQIQKLKRTVKDLTMRLNYYEALVKEAIRSKGLAKDA